MLHAFRYHEAGEPPATVRVPQDDLDLEFHGDIRLISTIEDRHIEYVARFTHGTLEWIRPWAEISEIHQSLLNAVD